MSMFGFADGGQPVTEPTPQTPLTDNELNAMETWAVVRLGRPFPDFSPQVAFRACQEIRRLRAQVAGHAERIAGQAALLGKCAEKLSAFAAEHPSGAVRDMAADAVAAIRAG